MKELLTKYRYFIESRTDSILNERPNPYVKQSFENEIMEEYNKLSSKDKLYYYQRLPLDVRRVLEAKDPYAELYKL